jgi:hypothetical protein
MTSWQWEFTELRTPSLIYSVGHRFIHMIDNIPNLGTVTDLRFDKSYRNEPSILLTYDSGYTEWANGNYPTLTINFPEY